MADRSSEGFVVEYVAQWGPPERWQRSRWFPASDYDAAREWAAGMYAEGGFWQVRIVRSVTNTAGREVAAEMVLHLGE